MKHILNNLTEQEKNAIREQHTGGMKVSTDRFSQLLESKLGDVKPILSEQMTSPKVAPSPEVAPPSKKVIPSSSVGDVTKDLKGKTVNMYRDPENKDFLFTSKIESVDKGSGGVMWIKFDRRNSAIPFECGNNFFSDGTLGELYSNNLTKELAKRFCTKSSGGTTVPSADFAKSDTPTSNIA